MRDLFRASQRYKSAIAELEPSRDALNDETALISYLTGHGGAAGGTNNLAGRIGYVDSKPPMSFAAVLDELRADADHLAGHPVSHDDPQPRVRPALAHGPGVNGMRKPGWGG